MIRSQGWARVTWASLPGKPSAYPPAPHTHPISDVTGLQAALDSKAATGSVTWSNLSGKPSTFPPSAHTHLWADITDRPTTFAPSAHTHAIADVTGLQAALDSKVAPTWATLSGKPATFTPSAHTHLWADITDRPTVFALGTATPLALGTATAGTSTNASHEDHRHALPAGLLTLVGNVVVTETLLLSLSLGVKRMTVQLATIATTDKLIAIPNGNPTTGCEMINVYPVSAGNVSVGYFVPALGIGATYTIPVSVYRLT